jgi:hypothetical protein
VVKSRFQFDKIAACRLRPATRVAVIESATAEKLDYRGPGFDAPQF